MRRANNNPREKTRSSPDPGIRKVTLRSTTIVRNHLSAKIEVFNKTASTKLGLVQSGESFAVPPQFVAEHCVLVKPIMAK